VTCVVYEPTINGGAPGQRLSHGSTPLTMTFRVLGAALAGLLRQPQDVRPAQKS
jgi:hypothetical protein